MLISDELSKKIRILSTFAMISVIFIHVNNIALVENAKPWLVFFSDWFFTGLQMWAVPFFFIVSGFFFDKGFEKKRLTFLEIKHFLNKKIKMLLVPYLLWGIIGALLICPLFIFHNYINGSELFERTVFGNLAIGTFLNNLLGLLSSPLGNGPLWYVRLLIILFVFAPIWVLLRRVSRILLFMVAIGLILFFSPVNEAMYSELLFNCFSIKVGGIGWFLLGMALSAFNLEDKKLPTLIPWACLGGWIFVMGGYFYSQYSLFAIIYRIAPLPLILFIWMSVCSNRDCRLLKTLSIFTPFTFFIYCMHMSVAATISAFLRHVVGCTSVTALMISGISFLSTLFICYFSARLCKSKFPKLFNILSGGR